MSNDSDKISTKEGIASLVVLILMGIGVLIVAIIVFGIFWLFFNVPVAIISTIIFFGIFYCIYQATK